jgi:hypothetical protein
LVCGNSKRFSIGKTCAFQFERAFGLCAKISKESPHRTSFRCAPIFLGRSLSRLRVSAQGGRFRVRPRAPACLLSDQGFNFLPGQFLERRLGAKAPIGRVAGNHRKVVGKTLLVSILLCGFLWRSPIRNGQAVCRKTKRRTGLLPALEDGVSAPKNLMNPHAVALGRLGGLKGGPARAASLSPDERQRIARSAAMERWRRQRASDRELTTNLDLKDRSIRRAEAQRLAILTGADVDTIEQVLFMQTLPVWERLARGLRRARLGQVQMERTMPIRLTHPSKSSKV